MKSNSQLRLGAMYVALVLLLAVAAGAQSSTPTITELFGFPYDSVSGLYTDGSAPWDTLIQASDGSFYGTTTQGGDDGSGCPGGCGGTIFKITPAGRLSVLFTFPPSGAYGMTPYAGLVEASDGNLYGVTSSGGAGGVGTIFRVSKSGTFKSLYSFCQTGPPCLDGANPWVGSGLTQARDGGLYGTTFYGGAMGVGVVFRITTAGVYTPLHSMNPSAGEGSGPAAGLIQASDGNLYGVNSGYLSGTAGTIFRVTPAGAFSVLYTFGTTPGDGYDPIYPLMQASDGNLYGTTYEGGFPNGNGNVFAISLSGVFRVVYNFTGGADGVFPYGPLIQASDRNLWGTTHLSPTGGPGNIFALTSAGALVHSVPLDCGANGGILYSGLVQAASGVLYGASSDCGIDSNGNPAYGTIFTVKAGLPKPAPRIASFSPTSGTAGTKVHIRGQHFIATSAVAFNGVSATFRVNNTGYITATVPAGATTGPIAVTNPGGTSVSKGTFTVQ